MNIRYSGGGLKPASKYYRVLLVYCQEPGVLNNPHREAPGFFGFQVRVEVRLEEKAWGVKGEHVRGLGLLGSGGFIRLFPSVPFWTERFTKNTQQSCPHS